jgi:PAS domain-containing protein
MRPEESREHEGDFMAESDGDLSLEDLPSERFEAILGSISDGVFTVDRNGRITCFNRAAETITGYGRACSSGAIPCPLPDPVGSCGK